MTQKITIEVALLAKFQPKDPDTITKNEGDNMKVSRVEGVLGDTSLASTMQFYG